MFVENVLTRSSDSHDHSFEWLAKNKGGVLFRKHKLTADLFVRPNQMRVVIETSIFIEFHCISFWAPIISNNVNQEHFLVSKQIIS